MKYIMKHAKSIFYTLIILFLCIVDQRRGSAPGQVQFIFVNLSGVAVCLLMFSAYKLKEFLRLPYWIWTIIFAVGAIVVTYVRDETIIYRGQWYTALINVWLIGLLVIKMISKIFIEKYRPNFSKKALVLFLGFMLLACFSRNDSLWTWWYLFLFTMLYLTDFSSEDRQRLFNAIPNGIILGFFVIQGLAFVFRPYDVLRYHGLYANENMNALFYSLVYCAFLGKYCLHFAKDKEEKNCRIKRLGNLIFCGGIWSFVFLSICRTAMFSMAIVTVCAGVYCLFKVQKNILRNVIGMIVGLVAAVILCAPLTYCAVRYLPAIFHHPIWYGEEYSIYRVHSWDSIDSPKYISWQQVLEGILGRWSEVNLDDLIVEDENGKNIYLASMDTDELVAKMVQRHVVLGSGNSLTSVNVRKDIFIHYYKQLNLRGHLNEENGVQLTKYDWVPHAHNLFLQMAFSFGIPAAILLFVWLGYGVITAAKKAFGINRDARMAIILLFYINIVVFGMLEVVWVTGQLSFTLLFLLPLFLFEGKRISIVEK